MKKVFLIMSALFSASSFAEQCDINPQVLKATYTIINKAPQALKNNKENSQTLTLWRNEQQVAHLFVILMRSSAVLNISPQRCKECKTGVQKYSW